MLGLNESFDITMECGPKFLVHILESYISSIYKNTKFIHFIQNITSEIGIQCDLDSDANQKNTNFQINKKNQNNHNIQFFNPSNSKNDTNNTALNFRPTRI